MTEYNGKPVPYRRRWSRIENRANKKLHIRINNRPELQEAGDPGSRART
jgi:hypothetical protein